MEDVSAIKVILKDFRVFVFDFRLSQHAVALTNQIVHFAFLGKQSISASFRQPTISTGRLARYNSVADWQSELSRTAGATAHWRVSLFNEQRQHVAGYPECVVVPRTVLDHMLQACVGNWTAGRFPVWSWSDGDGGCALLRATDLSTLSMQTEHQWEWFERSVTDAHPDKRRPDVLDVSADPSSVSNAFAALLRLCTGDSASDAWAADDQWYLQLAQTSWMQLVDQALQSSQSVVEALRNRRRSVILKEGEDAGMCSLVASISQLCCDAFFRTVDGFTALIQKEWVALSHQFGVYLHGIPTKLLLSKPSENCTVAPYFLLFLDCVWQLSWRYGDQFEFSSIYLVAMWDLALTGLTSTFSGGGGGADESPAWPIQHFYTEEYSRLFVNAAYVARLAVEPPSADAAPTLSPPSCAADLRFWTDCYARWTPFAQTRGGGELAKADRLTALARQVAALSAGVGGLSVQPLAAPVGRCSGFPFCDESQPMPDYDFHTALPPSADEATQSAASMHRRLRTLPVDLEQLSTYGRHNSTPPRSLNANNCAPVAPQKHSSSPHFPLTHQD